MPGHRILEHRKSHRHGTHRFLRGGLVFATDLIRRRLKLLLEILHELLKQDIGNFIDDAAAHLSENPNHIQLGNAHDFGAALGEGGELAGHLHRSAALAPNVLALAQDFDLMALGVELNDLDLAFVVGHAWPYLHADGALVGFFVDLVGDLRSGDASHDLAGIAEKRPNLLYRLFHLKTFFYFD